MGITFSENRSFKQGVFTPTHPEKYKGKRPIIFRSSWELNFMRFLDTTQAIIEWSSESLVIGYINPVSFKPARYYPDFLIKYVGNDGEEKIEVIEIKPSKQTHAPSTHGNKKKSTLIRECKTWAVNQAKWKAAEEFCRLRNISFRIITEKGLKIL